jgi:hypothetical protein
MADYLVDAPDPRPNNQQQGFVFGIASNEDNFAQHLF